VINGTKALKQLEKRYRFKAFLGSNDAMALF
jgi:hypothetical protein